MSRHSGFVIASALSRTSETGSRIAAMEPAKRMTSVTPAPRVGGVTEHSRCKRLDAIQRGGEVGEEDGGVVVVMVCREPCDARLPVLGPLGEQGRLSVARRRHDSEHRDARRCDEALDERGPADDARAKTGRAQFRRVEREAGQ